jgi:hypothetical protein
MSEFVGQDLGGSRFEWTSLRSSSFEYVDLQDARLRSVDLSGVQVRSARVRGLRMHGVDVSDVEINGEIEHRLVNGVDVGPLVEQELNRRSPERAKMRPDDVAGFVEAWGIVRRRWDETTARAAALPAEALHARVDGEWSFIETLRHLNFASAAWVGRMILGDVSPWDPLDLPWDEAPGWDGIPWDRDARPSLDAVLAVRHERHAMVTGVIESLTEAQLSSQVSQTAPGWPRYESFPFAQCLRIVLKEEWQHRDYAERDLASLEASTER